MRRVERPLPALAVIGDVVLDLRGAEVPRGQVFISATAVMGDVKVHVPDGVDVQLSGIAVMGDKVVKVREAAPGQKVPTVVVKATAVMATSRSSVTRTRSRRGAPCAAGSAATITTAAPSSSTTAWSSLAPSGSDAAALRPAPPSGAFNTGAAGGPSCCRRGL